MSNLLVIHNTLIIRIKTYRTINKNMKMEKKIKMDKEHPLTNTLINLKEFMEDLSNYDAPESSDGWSLSNLPSHFWQTLGECINDIEDYIKNEP